MNIISNFVLTLSLQTEKFQEDILDKRLEIARNIYNSLTNKVLKRYNLMLESKEYNTIKKQLNPINKEYHNSIDSKVKKKFEIQRKELYKSLKDVYLKYGLSQYSLYGDVKSMYKHFKDNIKSLEARAIADRVWNKFDRLLHGNAKKICFKKYNEINSIENKRNGSGLRYINNCIIWNNLKIPIVIKKNDVYAQQALKYKIKYCRIIRKIIKSKYHYYVQLILEGVPPLKCNKDGKFRNPINKGKIGLDIGTQTIAICNKNEVKLLELAPEINNIKKEKRRLQRKLDRSRRSTNPNKYNKNGTIKKGNKDKWVKSNHYIKTQMELKEIQRKQKIIRKQSHEKLANYILTLGDNIKVENMNYKSLQKRAKKTTKNKNGKFNSKKRFGKSLENKAPSMFLTILDNKLKWIGKGLNKIDTWNVKASQYNHINDNYKKKSLSDRWNYFNINGEEFKIQRDLYSAFLIMNVKDNLKEIDRDLCFENFEWFKKLHDIEFYRLKNCGNKLLSSMGI